MCIQNMYKLFFFKWITYHENDKINGIKCWKCMASKLFSYWSIHLVENYGQPLNFSLQHIKYAGKFHSWLLTRHFLIKLFDFQYGRDFYFTWHVFLFPSFQPRILDRKLRMRGSMYYFFINDWLKVFPRNQFYILRTEDYKANMTLQLFNIFKFLGLGMFKDSSLLMSSGVNAVNNFVDNFNYKWVILYSLCNVVQYQHYTISIQGEGLIFCT